MHNTPWTFVLISIHSQFQSKTLSVEDVKTTKKIWTHYATFEATFYEFIKFLICFRWSNTLVSAYFGTVQNKSPINLIPRHFTINLVHQHGNMYNQDSSHCVLPKSHRWSHMQEAGSRQSLEATSDPFSQNLETLSSSQQHYRNQFKHKKKNQLSKQLNMNNPPNLNVPCSWPNLHPLIQKELETK